MFSSIAAHNKNHIGIFNVNPVVCHCTASERLCQSRNSGAVSGARLMIHIDYARAAQGLMHQGAFLIGGMRGAHHEDML